MGHVSSDVNGPRLLRILWDNAVLRVPLLPHERMSLDVWARPDEDAWDLDAHRFFVDKRGVVLKGGYRVARTTIQGRAFLNAVKSWPKDAVCAWIGHELAELVARIRRRLPVGWRLFSRRPA